MGYEGHVAHELPGPKKEAAVAGAMGPLLKTRAEVERGGFPVEVVSVGGTGTYCLFGRYPGVTEVQAGSYLLMDTKCCTDFDLAHTELATVVSKCGPEHAGVDAGLKELSSERGLPIIKDREGLALLKLNAEHGIVELVEGSAPVEIGDKIEIWVRYSDAMVNLHDRMYGVRNGQVEKVFAITG
jgi:D-serine deaminase-like pyridoxal phosphate-dependent protein